MDTAADPCGALSCRVSLADNIHCDRARETSVLDTFYCQYGVWVDRVLLGVESPPIREEFLGSRK